MFNKRAKKRCDFTAAAEGVGGHYARLAAEYAHLERHRSRGGPEIHAAGLGAADEGPEFAAANKTTPGEPPAPKPLRAGGGARIRVRTFR